MKNATVKPMIILKEKYNFKTLLTDNKQIKGSGHNQPCTYKSKSVQ